MRDVINRFIPQYLSTRIKALADSGAWLLMVIGLGLFTLRLPFGVDGWINLPAAVTVFQTAGLAFMVFGMQIIASIIMWPQFSVTRLYRQVIIDKSLSAATLMVGLLVFNGLTFFGIMYWLSSAVAMGVVGR